MATKAIIGTAPGMTAERWGLLKSLFNDALELGDEARTEFIERSCSDPELAADLRSLLRHHEAATSVLSGPILSRNRMQTYLNLDLRTFVPGEIVATRFRIIRFIAEGGMGEVYAAEDLELGEPVALKTILPSYALDKSILARFKQEILLARKVTHRNVSRVFDLFFHELELGGERRIVVFLSMELLEGETLEERIHRCGPLSPNDALALAQQLAAGLDAAHKAGIVHRDLKCGNVALVPDRDGEITSERVVIMDFGLAGTLSDQASGEPSPGVMGTPAYMAPEQVMRGPITPAADIYAMGVVLFELLTGRLPFSATTPMETAHLQLHAMPPKPSDLNPAVPSRWNKAVLACLAKEPANRPATAGAVVSMLSSPAMLWKRALVAVLVLASLALSGLYFARPHPPAEAAQAAVDGARVAMENQTKDGYLKAIEGYEKAVAIDANWAQAWAELAYAYAAAGNATHVSRDVASQRARTAALRAIALDSSSAKAWGALGWVQSLDFDDWPKAQTSFLKATSISPVDGQTRYWYGVYLRKMGKFAEAEEQDKQALQLTHQKDPMVWCELAFLYWTWERQDKLAQHMQQLLIAFPNFGLSRYLHARELKQEGRFGEAEEELDFSEKLQYPKVTVLSERASLEAYRKQPVRAHRLLGQLNDLSHSQPVDGLLVAGVYAKLGEFDSAFAWLEDAYSRRDTTLLSLATSPLMKPLRGDPRYRDLLRRLHFHP